MELTTELLAKYTGGQLEIQNSNEHYLFRGEIERAWVEPGGMDDKGTMHIRFKWLAKMGEDFKWHASDESLDYSITIAVTNFSEISDQRIVYSAMYIWERGAFFLPTGSKLDPSEIEGLVITGA